MRVPAMFDFVAYNEKPSNNEVGRIKNRIQMQGVKDYTLEELYNKCIAGYSFIPGVLLGGLKKSNWKYQQVFAIDVDDGMGVEEALAIYKEVGLEPFAIYKSYSHTEEHQKFRVLFCMDECIDDLEVRDKVLETLAGLLGCADKKCLDAAHYFNGTSKGGAFFREIVIKKEDVLSHWKEEYSDLLSSKKTRKGSGRGRKKSDRDYTPYVDGKIVPFVPATYRLNAKADVNALKKMFETRRWKEGDHRERFVFVLYNVAKIAYGAKEALEMVQEMNDKMAEPLSERELYWAIEHTECHTEMTDIHGNSIYIFKRETVAKEEWLDLTEDEIAQSGFLATSLKNKKANENRPYKNARKDDIISLRKEGVPIKEIKAIVDAKYGKEVGTISTRRIYKICELFPQTIYNNIFSNSPIDDVTTQEEPMQTNDEPTLNEKQQLALGDALRGNNLVISGNGGGVGKSLLIRKITEALEKRGKTVAVTAATALAAENINGETLHRAMKMYFDEDSIVTSNMIYNAKQYDTIIIDEASMVGARTFEFFCRIREEVRRRYNKYIQVVLVCDVLQLPPVNDRYFFQTESFENLHCNFHYLTENYRQNGDATYLGLINKVRVEEDTTYTTCELNRVCSHTEDARYAYLTPRKSEAFLMNQRHLSNLDGELIDLGNVSVKIGAKVIVTENNSRAGYYNGMQGIVESVEKNVVTIVTTRGRRVKLHKKTIHINESDTVLGYPLDLGYAITIHKSQGMTLEGANINPKCFDCGQLYVALSRMRSASGVHLLSPIRPEYIKVNEEALAFDSAMRTA